MRILAERLFRTYRNPLYWVENAQHWQANHRPIDGSAHWFIGGPSNFRQAGSAGNRRAFLSHCYRKRLCRRCCNHQARGANQKPPSRAFRLGMCLSRLVQRRTADHRLPYAERFSRAQNSRWLQLQHRHGNYAHVGFRDSACLA